VSDLGTGLAMARSAVGPESKGFFFSSRARGEGGGEKETSPAAEAAASTGLCREEATFAGEIGFMIKKH